MKVKFANGRIYEAETIDKAIKNCLADGHDPFKPVIVLELKKSKKQTQEKVEEDGNQEQY